MCCPVDKLMWCNASYTSLLGLGALGGRRATAQHAPCISDVLGEDCHSPVQASGSHSVATTLPGTQLNTKTS